MAKMPDAGGMRPRAAMTNAEKARKKPAMRPEPSAARNVKANDKDPIADFLAPGATCGSTGDLDQPTSTSSQKPKRSATCRIEGRGAS